MIQTTMKILNDKSEMVESDNGSAIWRYFDSPEEPTWKVYVEDAKLARQIRGWQGVQNGGVYFAGNGKKVGEDFIIPRRLLRRALRLIGIELTNLRREPTPAQLKTLSWGRENLFDQTEKVGSFTGCFSENSPVDERSQADPMFDTPSDTGAFIGQNFTSKVKGETT